MSIPCRPTCSCSLWCCQPTCKITGLRYQHWGSGGLLGGENDDRNWKPGVRGTAQHKAIVSLKLDQITCKPCFIGLFFFCKESGEFNTRVLGVLGSIYPVLITCKCQMYALYLKYVQAYLMTLDPCFPSQESSACTLHKLNIHAPPSTVCQQS